MALIVVEGDKLKGFISRACLKCMILFLLLIFSLCVFAEDPGVQTTGGKLSHYGIGTSPPPTNCSDGTAVGVCSTDKPKYCCSESDSVQFCSVAGELVDNCNDCGCSSGLTCNTSTGHCESATTPQSCSDGTPLGQCSTSKPKYCDGGVLVDNCQQCGCPSGLECKPDGSCGTPAASGECTICSPQISSIDVSGGLPLTPGKQVTVNLELGECTASKIVLIVSTRQLDYFNTYWKVFGYPAMEEFASIQEAFDSIQTARVIGDEKFSYHLFKKFVVDALIRNGSFTGSQQLSIAFTEENLDTPFKAKRGWLRAMASEYSEIISGLDASDAGNIPDQGFFEATRAVPDKFEENVYFKVAVKDDCDGRWKFTGFYPVRFVDSATAPPTETCSDGTLFGECSANKPKYCDEGTLVDKCQVCGCPSGLECKPDGSCGSPTPGQPGPQRTQLPSGIGREEPGTQGTQGGVSGGGCFIRVNVEYSGASYESGHTISIDTTMTSSLSFNASFSLSQGGCEISEGEYGFWGNANFTGAKEDGGQLSETQLQEMSNGNTVEISGIQLSNLSRFAGSNLYFGLKGSVKPSGASVFSGKNSGAIIFDFAGGGAPVTPPAPPGSEPGSEPQPPSTEPEELSGCNPCKSIVGCLACLDYKLVQESFD